MSDFVTISNARNNLPKLVERVSEGSESVTITVNGKPKVTLINTEELESIMETAEILAIPGARKEIREGMEEIKKGKFVKLQDLDK
ncbi:MAG TPA: type II toxin-antitoxin system Phd/YefM family antitoxin [Candidatus Saccharimonadales bacterium]|nr:type II toxin-antitoxin system Phd/YefM family antitoxin [Candidatus Saccharimonadales bacterium]